MTAVERIFLTGAVGDIETLIESPAGPPVAVAICCHPHPLFGGSMTNKVIHTVGKAFLAAGAVVIRFNFRGVGASAGVHDEGRGETDDVAALARGARERWPNLPLWLGGFSFGAWIALRAPVSPALLVTVAPPVGRWDFSKISPPESPWLVIQGDRDELVDAAAVEQWVRASGAASLVRLPEADHFFHARLHEVREAVATFLASAAQARSV
ncbi:MAG: alpha/beta hydrolase [Gammaproteobacteria bacterium]